MKKLSKNLAAILSAITLTSSLSPVGAIDRYPEMSSFAYGLQHHRSPQIQTIEEVRTQRQVEARWIAEEQRRAETLRRIEEWKRGMIIELQEISNKLRRGTDFSYTFDISDEPITPEDIRNMVILIRQNNLSLKSLLFPTGQMPFFPGEFEVSYLVMCAKGCMRRHLRSGHEIPKSCAIQFLCFLDPRRYQTINACRFNLSGHNGELKFEFISRDQSVFSYTISLVY